MFLRYASMSLDADTSMKYADRTAYNEQRHIVREDLGFYNTVTVGATYEFNHAADIRSQISFFGPLRHCIQTHSSLRVAIGSDKTRKPHFEHVTSLELRDHIHFAESSQLGQDSVEIQKVLLSTLDIKFRPSIPPWTIVILPLAPSRCFIAFAYSHAIGDGLIGPAFHQTFLNGCQSLRDGVTSVVEAPMDSMPEAFDTRERLSFSLQFLLSSMVAMALPVWAGRQLDIQPPISPADSSTWTGAPSGFNAETSRNNIILREISAPILQRVLGAAKRNNTTFTGVILQIITRALSRAVTNPKLSRFVSTVPINMRRAIGMPKDKMGLYVSAYCLSHPRVDPCKPFTSESWAAASFASVRLAEVASTLKDHPIGMLRFLPDIRKWILSQNQKKRDSSFEVSNLGAFDITVPSHGVMPPYAKVSNMVFAQSGDAASTALTFNMVSLNGGNLTYTVSWLTGALGIVEREEEYIENICTFIDKDLESLE